MVQEDEDDVPDEVLEERGRALAVRVQDELGTDGWEVLYFMGGRAYRVHLPGSWPEETWAHDLLGHPAAGPQVSADHANWRGHARIVSQMPGGQPSPS